MQSKRRNAHGCFREGHKIQHCMIIAIEGRSKFLGTSCVVRAIHRILCDCLKISIKRVKVDSVPSFPTIAKVKLCKVKYPVNLQVATSLLFEVT